MLTLTVIPPPTIHTHKVCRPSQAAKRSGQLNKFAEYYPEAIADALEFEFGVRDITTVIDYLQELSETVTGTCEICGELVYADDLAFLPDGIECAHDECVMKSYQIDEDRG